MSDKRERFERLQPAFFKFDSKQMETRRKLEKVMMIYWRVPSRIFIFDKTPEYRERKIFPSNIMCISLFSSLLIELHMTLSSGYCPFCSDGFHGSRERGALQSLLCPADIISHSQEYLRQQQRLSHEKRR